MRTELVTGSDVEAALDEWAAVYATDPVATPFVSPAWARAWMHRWSPKAQPWVLMVRDGSRLAGLAPLTLRRYGALRVLGLLGKEPGDYWDVIAAPDDARA